MQLELLAGSLDTQTEVREYRINQTLECACEYNFHVGATSFGKQTSPGVNRIISQISCQGDESSISECSLYESTSLCTFYDVAISCESKWYHQSYTCMYTALCECCA